MIVRQQLEFRIGADGIEISFFFDKVSIFRFTIFLKRRYVRGVMPPVP